MAVNAQMGNFSNASFIPELEAFISDGSNLGRFFGAGEFARAPLDLLVKDERDLPSERSSRRFRPAPRGISCET